MDTDWSIQSLTAIAAALAIAKTKWNRLTCIGGYFVAILSLFLTIVNTSITAIVLTLPLVLLLSEAAGLRRVLSEESRARRFELATGRINLLPRGILLFLPRFALHQLPLKTASWPNVVGATKLQ